MSMLHLFALQPLAAVNDAYHGHIRARPCPRHNALKSLTTQLSATNGTVLIIGANTGPGPGAVDPMFKWLNSRTAAHLDKIFVEPMPNIFRALESNIAAMPRATAINAAVSSVSGHQTMYCAGLANDSVKLVAMAESATALNPMKWWTGTCSLARARLFNGYDFGAQNPLGSSTEAHQQHDALITETKVKTLTARQLLAALPSPPLYVQIDAEGYDDEILKSILDKDNNSGLNPKIGVMFEHVLLTEPRFRAAFELVKHQGYTNQCQYTQNILNMVNQ